MWDLLVALFEAWEEWQEAQRIAEWHAKREQVYLADWVRRRRLGIPAVAEDIT